MIRYGIKCNLEVRMKGLEKAFTSEEIAEYLRLHPYTIRKLAREKKIPAFRVGGQWRFRKDDIDAWSKSYSGRRS
ncbi:MAG: helix-turn-helix domain-containing protein [bacterium]